MKGLLTKDLEILKGNARSYMIAIGISVFYLFMGKNGVTFFLPYTSFVLSLLALNTISYDDFDNGMSYLMTLPVKRSTYVKEKYVLGLAASVVGWIITCIISIFCLALFFKSPWKESLPVMALSIFMGVSIMAVTLPIQLKLGTEKGQMVKIGVMMALWLAVLGAVKLAKMMNIDIEALFEGLSRMGGIVLFLMLILFLAVLVAVSFIISLRVIEKEEY